MANPTCIECLAPATLAVERHDADGKLWDNGPVGLCARCAQSLNAPDGRFRGIDVVLGLPPEDNPLVSAEPHEFDAQGRD